MGVLQVHLSGGEPASRRDLVEIVASAREAGLYTNLITSAIGLDLPRLARLKQVGLDHVQLSLQDVQADSRGSHRRLFRRTRAQARLREIGASSLAWPSPSIR